MKKYYEAYDKRYRQVHDKGIAWATNNNTKIVDDIINEYNLGKTKMLEIGCGEGRDARYLLEKGYDVLATDVSEEAIRYCRKHDIEHKDKYKVLDVLKDDKTIDKYGYIYTVACIHMLVLDEDRDKFYQYIYNHLDDKGYSLILSMGNGKDNSKTDIDKAFDNVKRRHQELDEEINIVATSCRIVDFDTIFKEAKRNNLNIIEYGITNIDNHFDKIMYILVRKV